MGNSNSPASLRSLPRGTIFRPENFFLPVELTSSRESRSSEGASAATRANCVVQVRFTHTLTG
jgi:hypothetical protein